MCKKFLTLLFLLLVIGCTTTVTEYVEQERTVEVDSLSQWDGFWVIPFPEGAKDINIEISAYPENDQFWSMCTNILINECDNVVELYDYDRGYVGRYYRLTYFR